MPETEDTIGGGGSESELMTSSSEGGNRTEAQKLPRDQREHKPYARSRRWKQSEAK